jgi:hypothetical protein
MTSGSVLADRSLLVLRATEGAVADVGAVADPGVGILSGVKRPMPLIIGATGTALHSVAMVAPWALAPVDPGSVTMVVVVGVELAHVQLAS